MGAAELTNSRDDLSAAQRGDRGAFERLVGQHRHELHVHCYRMLGSLHDADDALQEALLRAWRGLPSFGGRRQLRPWLYRIATNVTIDMVSRRSGRVTSLESGGAVDGSRTGPILSLLEPYPDQALGLEDERGRPEARYEQREAVELAFVAALQILPARQRAVLILRDVLGFSAAEVAELLDATVASVNSALQRARAAVSERSPQRSQQATLRSLGDARLRRVAERFADAWDRADVDTMVAMLTDDVVFTMAPEAPRHGAAAAAAFLPAGPAGRWRLVPTSANGQLAFGAYRWDPRLARHLAAVLDVVALRDETIAEITAFAAPKLFARFGLPEALAVPQPAGLTVTHTA